MKRRKFLEAALAVFPAATLSFKSVPEATETKSTWRRAQASLPLREKVRILLELQKQDLPLIRKQRALRSWEKPWPIEP